MELPEKLYRREALKFIAQSSIYGNLGLFVGAGFSKALMNEPDIRPIALGWLELIIKVAKKFGVNAKTLIEDGQSLPQLATAVIQEIMIQTGKEHKVIDLEFKQQICALTAYYPKKEIRTTFGDYLLKINPNWIITTNYDVVLECLLPGKCIALSPTEQLIAPNGIIPIYHLHGIKTIPSSIVVTQEDYISLFRPNEYRHTKLPLVIKESTTVLLGYGLNDMNVLTAVDWSKNVFSSAKINYPHEIFQIVFKGEKYKEEPYRNKDGIIIIEIEHLEAFFEELAFDLNIEARSSKKLAKDLKEINEAISNPTPSDIESFISKSAYRKELFNILIQYESYTISGFIEIFSKSLEKSWKKSRGDREFGAYNNILDILVDMIINIPFEKMPPILVEMLASNLNEVCGYVGDYMGMSWKAMDHWKENVDDLPEDTMTEIYNIAQNQKYFRLISFLDDNYYPEEEES
jgi:hypothetical protein